ncbi:MAG: hypothetical protein HYY17_11755 [Planctomycetes bacterium]|nr:hypothetical protein [Planctomycetota bacterium]
MMLFHVIVAAEGDVASRVDAAIERAGGAVAERRAGETGDCRFTVRVRDAARVRRVLAAIETVPGAAVCEVLGPALDTARRRPAARRLRRAGPLGRAPRQGPALEGSGWKK